MLYNLGGSPIHSYYEKKNISGKTKKKYTNIRIESVILMYNLFEVEYHGNNTN